MLESDVGPQAPHDQEPVEIVVDLVRFKCQWDEQVRFKTVGHTGSQHANYGVGFAIEPEPLADHLGIAAETLLPQLVGHDEHMVLAQLTFLGHKVPPQE